MKKGISTILIVIVIGIAILTSLGIMYGITRPSGLIPRNLMFAVSPTPTSKQPSLPSSWTGNQQSSPTGTPITMNGTMTCLVAKDNNAAVAMCALGINTRSGYYALNFLNQDDLISNKTATGTLVEVVGTLTPPTSNSPYKIIGTINVTSITAFSQVTQ